MRLKIKLLVVALLTATIAASSAYYALENSRQGPPPYNETAAFNRTAMLQRGNVEMGFNQGMIHHHFMATTTGGEIIIMSTNMSDASTISEIRSHVREIQYEFSQGNFTKPFYIHAEAVPGTDIMASKKGLIHYSVQDINGGSSLVLTTNDTELLKAIQQFMEFQSSQHAGN